MIHCHGIMLQPCEAEQADDHHRIHIGRMEDEYYVRIDHDMTKQHYISFIAGASFDRCQIVKLYPEGSAEARFRIGSVQKIYYYCNRDGMFWLDTVKAVAERECG